MYNDRMIYAIIAASGSGLRFGSSTPKQFLTLAGMPVLAHTIGIFEAQEYIDGIFVVVHPDYMGFCQGEIVSGYGFTKVVKIVPGGGSRRDSVYNGLLSLPPGDNIVLVHDGVRPFVSHKTVTDVICAADIHGCCIPGVIPKDTVKQCDSKSNAAHTPDRDSLRLIQTPQGFRLDILIRAYKKALEDGYDGTDDSALVERLGYTVKIVPGSYDNIKITTQDDLKIGEYLLLKHKGVYQ